MTLIKLKGYELNTINIRDSFTRRALRFQNNIIQTLKQIGLTEDDVYIELEPVAIKKAPASASWYVEGYHLHFSYKACNKYVENLHVVSKIIELEVNEIIAGNKTIDQFIKDFTEEKDVEKERKDARELLGLKDDELDFELINKQFKKLAKEWHPDMSTGDVEKFKALNRAHKILKRELV